MIELYVGCIIRSEYIALVQQSAEKSRVNIFS